MMSTRAPQPAALKTSVAVSKPLSLVVCARLLVSSSACCGGALGESDSACGGEGKGERGGHSKFSGGEEGDITTEGGSDGKGGDGCCGIMGGAGGSSDEFVPGGSRGGCDGDSGGGEGGVNITSSCTLDTNSKCSSRL